MHVRTKQLTENKSKSNITNELTNGEAERRQTDDECTKKHHNKAKTSVTYGKLRDKTWQN